MDGREAALTGTFTTTAAPQTETDIVNSVLTINSNLSGDAPVTVHGSFDGIGCTKNLTITVSSTAVQVVALSGLRLAGGQGPQAGPTLAGRAEVTTGQLVHGVVSVSYTHLTLPTILLV